MAVHLIQRWNPDLWNPINELNLEALLSEAKSSLPARPPRQQQRRLSREEKEKIVSNYKSGLTMAAVARIHNVHVDTVRRHLMLANAPILVPTPGIPDKELKNAKALRDAGWTLKAIGAKYGCSHTAVSNALKRKGDRM